MPGGSYVRGNDAGGPGRRCSQLLHRPPDRLRFSSLPQEKPHLPTPIVLQRAQKFANRWSNRRRRKVRSHILSPESAVAERRSCSARSVFIAVGPSDNGSRDSSCVHNFERRPNGREPGARCRALDPASRALRSGGGCGEGRAPNWRVSRPILRKERACSVSRCYAAHAIGRTARSALSFLIARAARAPPRAS